jgi:alginate O-acetyltransferase complex protein AlgJ
MIVHRAAARAVTRRLVLAGLAAVPVTGSIRAASFANAVVVGKNGWLFPIWDGGNYIDTRVIDTVTKTINTAVDAFRQAKIEVAICLLPAKSRVYADYLPNDRKLSPAVEKRYGEALKALAPSGAINFDQAAFFEALRKAAPNQDLFFKADTHWLPVAAASAAAEMANQIRAKGHLPPSSKPGMALSAPQTTTQPRNDLAALLPASEQASYPYESFLARDPVASGGAGLLDDDAPDVVVVGNSFMQPAYGYAATLSAELNRPVGLAWRVHQFSPYWNMLDYLKSPAFKQQRPKLIVWTFHEVDINTPVESPDVWGETAMAPANFLSQLHGLLGA